MASSGTGAVAFALALLAAASPLRSQTIPGTPPDRALTAALAAVDPNAPAPAVPRFDSKAYLNASGRNRVSGALRRLVDKHAFAAPGVRVYLIEASPYAAWFAAGTTRQAARTGNATVEVPAPVRDFALYSDVTDWYGRFTFRRVPPGSYYLFAEESVAFGKPEPVDHVARGVDGDGHAVDVNVPDIEIPQTRQFAFSYLYGFVLPPAQLGWNLGIMSPSATAVDGKAL